MAFFFLHSEVMGKNLNEYNNMSLQKTDAVPGKRQPKFTFFILFCAGTLHGERKL